MGRLRQAAVDSVQYELGQVITRLTRLGIDHKEAVRLAKEMRLAHTAESLRDRLMNGETIRLGVDSHE
jgi:2-phospho-L-lactate transferase/gluconeogenesis factor (CofD/UPF0052 family)